MVADFTNDELVVHAMFLGLSNNITGMNLQRCCKTGIAMILKLCVGFVLI